MFTFWKNKFTNITIQLILFENQPENTVGDFSDVYD